MFSVFFTMGRKAAKIYSSYGCSSKIIYPFMYLPIVDDTIKTVKGTSCEKIKGLYVGRFRFSTKGTDDLMCALNIVHDSRLEMDFVVVPSKCDGWNMAPYQSICAGIGCIVPDRAGSEEIIESSGSGVVFQAGNYKQLSDILSKMILDKSIVDNWKKRAVDFQSHISIEQVGSYFIKTIKYQFGEIKTKPDCPWNS